MALALNNLQRVDMPLNKETKPNLVVGRVFASGPGDLGRVIPKTPKLVLDLPYLLLSIIRYGKMMAQDQAESTREPIIIGNLLIDSHRIP